MVNATFGLTHLQQKISAHVSQDRELHEDTLRDQWGQPQIQAAP